MASFNADLADRAAAHAIYLLRVGSAAQREVIAFLARLEVQLEDAIRTSALGGKSLSFGRESRLADLLSEVRQLLTESYSAASAAAEENMAGIASMEAAYTVEGFRKVAVLADLGVGLPSASQLRALASNVLIQDAPSAEWWGRQAEDLMQRFSDEIRQGVALGETTDDLVRRIRGRATGKRNVYEIDGRQRIYVEFSGGIMDTATRNAEALVRTSVQTIAGAARRETLIENQDVVKGVVQLSTLDTRTTVECMARHMKSWSLPDFEPINHDIAYDGGVPREWNCRSTEAPVLKSWEELGIDLDDAPGGVRWSRLDGEVPADFSMEDFLRRRSDEQVNDMLGEGIADLWRAGKISLDDLIDAQTGRPLTLRELEAAFGSAA